MATQFAKLVLFSSYTTMSWTFLDMHQQGLDIEFPKRKSEKTAAQNFAMLESETAILIGRAVQVQSLEIVCLIS